MDYDQITDDVVKDAFIAWNSGRKETLMELMSDDIIFIHNGEKADIIAFSDQLFFGETNAKFTEIHKAENAGKTVFATLESVLTGKVEVLMHFETSNGKISFLDAGRP